jgi:hypothetical protein
MGRIICELERIYGISKGNNQHTNNVGIQEDIERIYGIKQGNNQHTTNGGIQKSQSDIAKELNTDMESYRRYKKLTTLIPELQEMVDSGSLT